MQRDREQFWLVAACVIAAHAIALVLITGGWAYWANATPEPRKAVEVAIVDPVVVVKEIEPPDENVLGETDGIGDSIATVNAPQPSVSQTPDDLTQAWTRQKPVAMPSQSASEKAAKPQTAEAFGPQSVTAMSPLTVKRAETKDEAPPTEKPSKAEPTDDPAAGSKSADEAKPAEEAKASPEQDSQQPPDPAEQGKSDLDPFAQEEGVSFTPGGTSARKGREVKLSRPRIDLGFRAEATRIWGRGLVVRMRIETDATGHPSRVVVLDSSGSDLIDDAVRLAMYDSWFGGKMPDQFPFTVRFVDR